MTTQPSRLALDPGDDSRTVVASGVIDSHTADRLLEHLQTLGLEGDVVIDVAGVEFIDSSGLRSIIVSHQELTAAGHRLVLRQPSSAVARLLEITGLDGHLETE